MRYTKGIRGPETTNDVTLQALKVDGSEANPMAKGVMLVQLKSGTRMVSLIAQGKNARALKRAQVEQGDNLRLTLRWTGREAVTVTGVAEAA